MEEANITFPISAWNIITEDEFYSSLSHLITLYPEIKIWIFKTNFDINRIGIAYLDIEKVDSIVKLKKEKKNNKNLCVEEFQKRLYLILKKKLNKYIIYAYSNLYKNFDEYLKIFLKYRGIIECCPTKNFNGIISHPNVPILIEPNGKINILPTFDKINVDNFKSIIYTSPQKFMDNTELCYLGEKIGNSLFQKGIIGFVTINFITYKDGNQISYSCIDMKYGYSQIISDMQYCYLLYHSAFNKINKSKNSFFHIENYVEKLSTDCMFFSIPNIISDYMKDIKLKYLINYYNCNKLFFNQSGREGIALNICDGLESGIFGLCGMINLEEIFFMSPEIRLWNLISHAFNVLKELIFQNHKNEIIASYDKYCKSNEGNDRIELISFINIITKMIKEKDIEQKLVTE